MFSPHTDGMTVKTNQTIKSMLYILGITIAVYIGMRFLLAIVIPFLIAYFIAWILRQPVTYLNRVTRLPRGIWSMVLVGLFVALIAVPIGFLIYKGGCEAIALISHYEEWTDQLSSLWGSSCKRLEELSGIEAASIEQFGRDGAMRVMTKAQEEVVPFLMSCSVTSLQQAAAFLGKVVITLVAAVLILSDHEKIAHWIKGRSWYGYLEQVWGNMCRAGGTYVKAQIIIILMICTVCILGLAVAGNPYAVLIGLLIGICDALPFIGTGLIFVPWLIIELFRENIMHAVLYGVLFIICTFIREFIEPRLVGKGLGVHPLAVIISIYAGLKIYGPTGVLLGPVSFFLIWEIYQTFCGTGEKEPGADRS